METFANILTDSIVIVFDLLFYMKLTKFKNDDSRRKVIAWVGCLVFFTACLILTYGLHIALSVASFVSITIPSFILFFILSEYKDARFVVTFCLVDTVMLIVGFVLKALRLVYGMEIGMAVCLLTVAAFVVIFTKLSPLFPRYRELLESVYDGWTLQMISTILIYILLTVAAAMPKPLIERQEYLPVYSFLCLTILSFYAVFINSLVQKKRLYEINDQLQREKEWHTIAYVDALTGIKNRMAYMERLNEVQRESDKSREMHAVMIDINDFKKINDNMGHHVGDQTLKKAAEMFKNVFGTGNCELFRIGGDEFAVIAADLSYDELCQKIEMINHSDNCHDLGCTFAIGCAKVDFRQHNAMENAFVRADRAMYEQKACKK